MKLSVIIVNYNVKYFLEQCLFSVREAIKQIQAEIIVVDNNSVDGSVAMLKTRFPDITLIENKKNVGFSVANNMGIRKSKGEYVLLLNPDTVVEEDSFVKILDYLDNHQEAGALGVKMLNGKGAFLPESKRGLPTPWVAFYKMFGLSKLFPRSSRFNYYHLGYLDENEIHEVDVLSGAFMMLRKTVLEKIGLLDETFFMYGEDIDLSYRVKQAGYKNIYFPKTTIIHYKGESTKKGSLNYVLIFYRAMQIFARKHYSSSRASWFSFIINLAIIFRAFLSITYRIVKMSVLPIADFLLIYGGISLISSYWGHLYLHTDKYPEQFYWLIVPIYAVAWLISIFFSEGYDNPIRLKGVAKGVLTGTVLIVLFYALLPETLRFSRMLIFLSTGWNLIALVLVRIVLVRLHLFGFEMNTNKQKQILIVANEGNAKQIHQFINTISVNTVVRGYVAVGDFNPKDNESHFVGEVSQLKELVQFYHIDELIFSFNDLSSQDIIHYMGCLSSCNLEYKIASPDSLAVIGSNSIDTNGELYVSSLNVVTTRQMKRIKYLFDVVSSLGVLILSPILIFLQKNPVRFYKTVFRVLFFQQHWVSYISTENNPQGLKEGVFEPIDEKYKQHLPQDAIEKINLNYAQHYAWWNDLNILVRNIGKIG